MRSRISLLPSFVRTRPSDKGRRAPIALGDMIKTMKRGLLISRFWDVRLVDVPRLKLAAFTFTSMSDAI